MHRLCGGTKRICGARSHRKRLIVEGIGKRVPIVAMPFSNRAQAAHPVFEENIARLRSWGVTVLNGPDVYPLHEPGEGCQTAARFPWHLTLKALAHKP